MEKPRWKVFEHEEEIVVTNTKKGYVVTVVVKEIRNDLNDETTLSLNSKELRIVADYLDFRNKNLCVICKTKPINFNHYPTCSLKCDWENYKKEHPDMIAEEDKKPFENSELA